MKIIYFRYQACLRFGMIGKGTPRGGGDGGEETFFPHGVQSTCTRMGDGPNENNTARVLSTSDGSSCLGV